MVAAVPVDFLEQDSLDLILTITEITVRCLDQTALKCVCIFHCIFYIRSLFLISVFTFLYRYTRLSLQQGAELPNTAEGTPHVGETDDDELEALERSILNYRELLRQVSSYPNRKLKQPGFLPYDPTDHLADPFSPLPPMAAAAYPPGPTSSVARLERRLKTLEELSDAYFVSVTVEQLTDTERRLRGDRSALHNARLIRDLSRRLPLTNFLFDHWDPDEGQREREQEEEEEKEEEKGPWPSLERFFSCTEEPHLGPRVETEGRGSPATEERGVALDSTYLNIIIVNIIILIPALHGEHMYA